MSLAVASRSLVGRHWLGLIAALALGAVPASARAATLVLLESQRGDPVGAGVRTLLTDADGTLAAAINEAGGASVFFDSATSHVASFHFAPPAGQVLSTRAYEGAIRFPFQNADHAGLDVGVDARSCKEVSGRFAILELRLGPGGEVEHFAADFEQHCQNAGPALFGAIRLNSEIAISDAISGGGIAPRDSGPQSGDANPSDVALDAAGIVADAPPNELELCLSVNAGLRASVVEQLTLIDQLQTEKLALIDQIHQEGDTGLLASLRAENAALASDKARIGSDNATLASDNAKLRSERITIVSDNAKLRADTVNLGSDNAKLRAERITLSADNAKLHGDNAVLGGENGRLSSLNAMLRADLDRLGSELYECREHSGQ